MSYKEFLNRIDEFVGHVVEFESRFKSDGKVFKTQRYVWDNKEFGEPSADALIEVVSVLDLGERKLNKSIVEIIAI